MDAWLNLVRGNNSVHLRVFLQRGGDPTSEPMVRFLISRSGIHQANVFRFLLPLSDLFPRQLRRLQVEYMLSHVGHPHRSNVYFWTDHISSYVSRAANAVLLEGYSGFLMVVHLNIPTVSARARMEDGVLMLDEAELMDDGDLMLSLEEAAAGGTREFGSVPASESSIKTLDTKTYQGEGEDGSTICSICLENFEAGAELIVLPCCHEFHCSCATKWLERSHLCPLCRYPMPTVDGEAATA
ncbi:uncharacterized protein [Elaeis guineensis]|uniref:uncharacterized protein n=1 Tax=Elaeis guineensis var. tenera TaxID=51953 RepID=UPI003C6CCC7F